MHTHKIFCREQHKRLQEKLKAVEGKIIVGGVNLVSETKVLDLAASLNDYHH